MVEHIDVKAKNSKNDGCNVGIWYARELYVFQAPPASEYDITKVIPFKFPWNLQFCCRSLIFLYRIYATPNNNNANNRFKKTLKNACAPTSKQVLFSAWTIVAILIGIDIKPTKNPMLDCINNSIWPNRNCSIVFHKPINIKQLDIVIKPIIRTSNITDNALWLWISTKEWQWFSYVKLSMTSKHYLLHKVLFSSLRTFMILI